MHSLKIGKQPVNEHIENQNDGLPERPESEAGRQNQLQP
jgi:hypothetical protein